MAEAWQRMRDEPDRAYGLFDSYLSFGPLRSLRKLADTGAASLSHLKQLSARWQWRERAAAWQAETVRTDGGNVGRQIEAIRERQLRDARMLRTLARAQMKRWMQHAREGRGESHRQLTGMEVARTWALGFQAEQQLLAVSPPTGRRRRQSESPKGSRWQRDEPVAEAPAADDECLDPEEVLRGLLATARDTGLPEEMVPEAGRMLRAMVDEYAELVCACCRELELAKDAKGGDYHG